MFQPPSRKQPGKPCFLCGVAPDRVYSNGRFHTPLGALLPHLSTLASSAQTSYPSPCRKRQISVIPLRLLSPQNFRFAEPHFWAAAVYFCCTFPQIALGGRYPLSLPCGARTFLTASLSALPRDCLSYSHSYFSPWRGACQRKMHCYFSVPVLY